MNPLKLNINNTTRFLLPIVFPDLTYNEFFSNYFEQAYLGILDDQRYDDKLILKLEDGCSPEDYFTTNILPEYIHDTVERDALVIYNIPDHIEDEYEIFIHGSYSKLSEESKQAILNFWEEDEDSMLHGVLYKTQKGAELLASYLNHRDFNAMQKNSDSEYWYAPNILKDELLFYSF